MGDFDPDAYRVPQESLTLVVKSLQVGGSVRLPDGTDVRAVAVRKGAGSVRRYNVGKHEAKSATEAAAAALKAFRRRRA